MESDEYKAQEWLERKKAPDDRQDEAKLPDQNDLKAYGLLFDALKREPFYGLSPGFAANVEKELIRRKKLSELSWKYTLIAVGLGLLALAGYILLLLPEVHIFSGSLMILAGNKWPLVFSILSVFLIQLMDYRLINSRNLPRTV